MVAMETMMKARKENSISNLSKAFFFGLAKHEKGSVWRVLSKRGAVL